jgi:hypothetical protein
MPSARSCCKIWLWLAVLLFRLCRQVFQAQRSILQHRNFGACKEAAARPTRAPHSVLVARVVQVRLALAKVSELGLQLRALLPSHHNAMVLLGVHVDGFFLGGVRHGGGWGSLCRQSTEQGRVQLQHTINPSMQGTSKHHQADPLVCRLGNRRKMLCTYQELRHHHHLVVVQLAKLLVVRLLLLRPRPETEESQR